MTLVTGVATVGGVAYRVSAPVTLPGLPPILVGNTIPPSALKPGSYDAGLTQAQADTKFCQIVGRGLGNGLHLPAAKKFWNQGNWDTSINDLRNYARFGTTVIFAIWPVFPVTSAEQANLASFLSTVKGFGFDASNSYIVLDQEPEVGPKVSAADFQTLLEGYGPTVNQSGLPLVADIGTGGGETALHAYGNAAIAALNNGVALAGLAQDYYAPQAINHGLTLNTLSGLADANGIGFGVFESGIVPSNFTAAQVASYINGIRDFCAARRAAGKDCLPWLYFDGLVTADGKGQLSSPIGQDPTVTQPDSRILLWQDAYDELCGLS